MSRIGVMMSADRPEGLMSSHFGKAKWFMVVDSENGVPAFVRNEGLNGRCAAEIAQQEKCSDVILLDIGEGALGHLQRAQIRVWAAPALMTGSEALRIFAEGKLSPVPAAHASERHGGHHHGNCGCHHGGGEGHSCCHG